MSPLWREVIRMAAGSLTLAAIAYDEIIAMARKQGRQIKRTSLRAQLSNYVAAGWLARAGWGRVRVNPEGAVAAGFRWPSTTNGTGGLAEPHDEKGPEVSSPALSGRINWLILLNRPGAPRGRARHTRSPKPEYGV